MTLEIGYLDMPLNNRFEATALLRPAGIDSYWLPDHLINLVPRSL